MTARLLIALALIACAFFVIGGGLAMAASGSEIREAVSNNTIKGNRGASGQTEFYRSDGTIQGEDYTGKWSVEGNSMCITYRGAPKECWDADINGTFIRWVKNGQVLGSGTIIRGNPENLGVRP
jgi:hypothetical protein